MFKKEKIIIALFLVLVIFGSIFFFFQKEKTLPIAEEKVQQPLKTRPTLLEINQDRYEGFINEPTSIYDFMSQLRQEGQIDFKEKNYIGMGEFVEEINGMKNNGDKNWIYYVNGKKANIGVSNYKLTSGDIVSWKYEKNI